MKCGLVGAVIALAAVMLMGCGSSAPPASPASAFHSEVREAMEMIGDDIDAREHLERSRSTKRAVRKAIALGEEARARNLLSRMRVDTDTANDLLKHVRFSRVSKKANEAAMKLVEEEGLIGNHCARKGGLWRC